jgi:dihydroxy-acid dehydratase
MALARMDLPGLVLYGGTIAAGSYRGKDVTIQDVFEAVGANAAGKITDQDLRDLENVACPGAGACGGQYTANTMSTVMEIIGLSPMGFNSVPAMDARKDDVAFRCGDLVMNLLKKGILPRRILTLAAFENAIASVAMSGGSTNAVLHLLAIAREAEVDLEIDDFQKVSEPWPPTSIKRAASRSSPSACWRPSLLTAQRSRSRGRHSPRKPTTRKKLRVRLSSCRSIIR